MPLRSRPVRRVVALPLLALASTLAPAQQPLTTLSGTVTDPSGALIPNATLHLTPTDPASPPRDLLSDAAGHFRLSLPPGTYTLTTAATGFDPLTQPLTLTARPVTLTLRLSIATTAEAVDVPSDPAASTANSDNKSALVLRADDLNDLSSNDATLQQEITSMAGGSGEGGAQIYVDGFSGGAFPPKDTIREVRINQNPFSSQYEDLGLGRIEIFTKPGTGQFHGGANIAGSTRAFNALNPYTGAQPPYYLLFGRANVSGPLGKRTSFFLSGRRNDEQNNAVVNAFNPDGTPLSLAVPAPTLSSTLALRIDRQLSTNNTLVARYQRAQTTSSNTGVGLLVLPSEGTSNSTTTDTLQLSNTALLGPNLVAESRFQYLRTGLAQTPNSTAPTLTVQGAFSGGGSPTQASSDSSNAFEFQQYFTLSHGPHLLRFGARYRLLHETNTSTANYNGAYTFPSLAAYQAGTPSLFSLTAGQSTATLLNGDLAAFLEDEWKLRPNLTLTLGFRLESQNGIPDHINPAPRAGFSWAVRQQTGATKRPALFVLRGNAGIFYARFAAGNLLTSIRQNGISQQAFLLTNPTFYPTIPAPSELTGTAPTPYTISPGLHVASETIGSLEVERSLGKIGTVTASYYAVRGVHQYNSENRNAPLPNGTRPLGGTADLYQFTSDGIEKAQAINLRANLRPTKRINAFVLYAARRQNADTFGAASFPSQPYNVSADFGPSGLSFIPASQHLFVGGNTKLPFGFTLDTFFGTFSRSRFNITTGTDRNNDTQFNDRPAFATNPTSSSVLYHTAFGTFDANPQPGESIIPINYALAPRTLFTAFGLDRDIHFGPRPPTPPGAAATANSPTNSATSTSAKSTTSATSSKPSSPTARPTPRPDPRYSLTLSIEAVNALNTNNPGTPVGVLTSPYFGHSISINSLFNTTTSASRVLFLGAQFHF